MKIKIHGVIVSNDDKLVYDWFEMDAVSPEDIEEQLEIAAGEDIDVEINSVGGNVLAGSEIYTMLRDYIGGVKVKIVGLAASAASVVAMAGDKILISPTAQIMIHNVWSTALGDYRSMEHEADVLKGWNKSIANAYMLKSGMPQKDLLELMNKETWLTAQEALNRKLVDEIMFDDGIRLAASVQGALLPPEVVNKIKSVLKSQQAQQLSNEPLAAVSLPPEPKHGELWQQAPVDLYAKLNLINRRKANV